MPKSPTERSQSPRRRPVSHNEPWTRCPRPPSCSASGLRHRDDQVMWVRSAPPCPYADEPRPRSLPPRDSPRRGPAALRHTPPSPPARACRPPGCGRTHADHRDRGVATTSRRDLTARGRPAPSTEIRLLGFACDRARRDLRLLPDPAGEPSLVFIGRSSTFQRAAVRESIADVVVSQRPDVNRLVPTRAVADPVRTFPGIGSFSAAST